VQGGGRPLHVPSAVAAFFQTALKHANLRWNLHCKARDCVVKVCTTCSRAVALGPVTACNVNPGSDAAAGAAAVALGEAPFLAASGVLEASFVKCARLMLSAQSSECMASPGLVLQFRTGMWY